MTNRAYYVMEIGHSIMSILFRALRADITEYAAR